jgi:hypothetical protein
MALRHYIAVQAEQMSQGSENKAKEKNATSQK